MVKILLSNIYGEKTNFCAYSNVHPLRLMHLNVSTNILKLSLYYLVCRCLASSRAERSLHWSFQRGANVAIILSSDDILWFLCGSRSYITKTFCFIYLHCHSWNSNFGKHCLCSCTDVLANQKVLEIKKTQERCRVANRIAQR